ncbi:hypothetical protein GDO81_026154 [Engystomops pustulosus]|uniref:Uncharacterized protein n=1 Tax=Engystomops pustulosus TaxID=76066 RepID=A0AAV6ZNM9_ENGPU|nr:hypothetical protein GDO81_026154 [Engystomops pustulosus]
MTDSLCPARIMDAERSRHLTNYAEICVNVSENVEDTYVNDTHCQHLEAPATRQDCAISCPGECVMSNWGQWSQCTKIQVLVDDLHSNRREACLLVGEGGTTATPTIRPKYYRNDLTMVYEALPCYNECNQYWWVTEPWSACKLHSEEKTDNCGAGIQIRRMCECFRNAEDTYVNDTHCQNWKPLQPDRTAPYPALGMRSCDTNSTRSRTRFPLRIPTNGKTCPEDSETEPCVLNSNCFHYQYNVTEWSACQLSEKAVCGEGIKTRLLDCTRSDGKSVKMSFCEQQMRSRHIKMHAEGEGRPCPTQLTQYRSCAVNPCYSWNFGQWSTCRVEVWRVCGEGLKTRNLTCLVHDASPTAVKIQVDPKFCGQLPNEENVRSLPCYVPCPGDCHLTEWSQWSSCQVACIDGRAFEAIGRQSRSRTFIVQSPENQENCPKPVIETRPCTGGRCFRYSWKMSPWMDNKRTVWCQRSDGANVTGGCSMNSRPAAVQQCDPPCRKPFSYCMQSGVCGCESGYTQIMRSSGVLDYCLKVPGTESKKADVKTYVPKSKPINSKLPEIFSWSIQLFDQGKYGANNGRVSLWVYVVCAGSFLILVFLIIISYLVCRKPPEPKTVFPQQKPLTLAYDGDFDM